MAQVYLQVCDLRNIVESVRHIDAVCACGTCPATVYIA